MKSKYRWLLWLLGAALLLLVLLAGFNFATDPRGALGDQVLGWWAYDMTAAPGVAKPAYLSAHRAEYDSFLLAGDDSALPVEELDRLLGGSFYDLSIPGARPETLARTAAWLLSGGEVKTLVLELSPALAAASAETEPELGWQLRDGSAAGQWLRALATGLQPGLEKLRCRSRQGYLREDWATVLPETGARDRSLEDVERVAELDRYLAQEGRAAAFETVGTDWSLLRLEDLTGAVAEIRALCEAAGTELLVLCPPVYAADGSAHRAERERFCRALAQVTEFWDFTESSLSRDPRYFYDPAHARRSVGSMELDRMLDLDQVWRPADFGRFVERGTVPDSPAAPALPETANSVRLSILRYHHLIEAGETSIDMITMDVFRDQMEAIRQAGYNTVDIWQIRDYVERGTPLPEKPLLICFDDGYRSNYELAFPVLREYGFKATIFAIGVSMGKDSYKDTGISIIPHFSLEEAREMTASGLITVASHGYNVHENKNVDQNPIRPGALQREDETEAEYVAFLTEDALHMQELLGEAGGFFAYPTSRHDARCVLILNRAGVFATVCDDAPSTLLVRGLPQCLLDMPRQFVSQNETGADLIALLTEEK